MDCGNDNFFIKLEKKKQIVKRSVDVKVDGTIGQADASQISPLVGVSDFVKRQTKDSTFTHFSKTWRVLTEITTVQMGEGDYDYGYRDGVIIVHMSKIWTNEFFTFDAYPMFEGMNLDAQWAKTPGREHEPAKLQVSILEPKIQCNFVDIILYRKNVLQEDKDETTGADWDIVSINGRLKRDPPPIDPMTLVRNWLHLKGGTEMKGTTSEKMLTMLCDSVLYKNGLKKHMSKNKKEK